MADRFDEQCITYVRMDTGTKRKAWQRGRVVQWGGILLAWGWLALVLFLLRPFAFTPGFEPYSIAPPTIGTLLLDVVVTIILPIITTALTALSLPFASSWIGSGIVRAGILTGDAALAEIGSDQPKPLEGDESLLDARRFAALTFLAGERLYTVVASADAVFFLALTVASAFLWLWVPRGLGGMPKEAVGLALLFVLPVMSTGRLFAFYGLPQVVVKGWWILFPGRRQKVLAVDDWGIRWRERHWRTREHSLAWQDINAFCMYRNYRGFSADRVFILLGQNESFSWVLPAGKKEEQRAAGELMAQVAVARTRMPVCDLETTLGAVKSTRFPIVLSTLENPIRYKLRWPVLTHLLNAPRERVLRALYTGYEQLEGVDKRPLRMKLAYYWVNSVLIVMLTTGVCISWMIDQQRSDDYYHSLPARVAAEQPLFSDSLTSPDNTLPVQTPDSTDTTRLGYSNGGYSMTGGPQNHDHYAWFDDSQVDMAIEVTVRQIGSSDSDGVGLIARHRITSGDQSDMLIFEVSPSQGYWSLYHLQPGHANPDDDWNTWMEERAALFRQAWMRPIACC